MVQSHSAQYSILEYDKAIDNPYSDQFGKYAKCILYKGRNIG